MEVVRAGVSGNVAPYQRRDVEEWSHRDHLTGMLEHARVETDHWATNTHNTTHKYGKVVDSRDRCAADGTKQQRQRRQLEVFQAQVPGGSIQVIRTQTVASSSSKWSSTSRDSTTSTLTHTGDNQHFDNLQLALYPLDSSSQKTKASVGRSGSIGGRRPPSRPRAVSDHASTQAHSVSRLCHQLHADTLAQSTRPASRLKPADGSVPPQNQTNTPIIDLPPSNGTNGFSGSSSPVNFHKSFKPDLPSNWSAQESFLTKRTSSPTSKPDLETGRRLSTALRGNNIDLDALDQILKTISSCSEDTRTDEKPERDTNCVKETLNGKRESFVTVESLQEVRGRLRKLSSPTDDFYKDIERVKDDEADDGIVAEDNSTMKREETNGVLTSSPAMSRVRSYVYGMEAMLHKKPIIGTGSLESRTSNKSSGSSTSRSEDWYNRRKSYGFEQVHGPQIDQPNSISLRGKNKIESSTDSGICRSIEIVVVPSVVKTQAELESSPVEEDTNHYNSYKSVPVYNKTGTSTVINLSGEKTKCGSSVSVNVDHNDPYNKPTTNNELFAIWNKRAIGSDSQNDKLKKEPEQITITIPIVSEEESCNTNIRRVFHRQLSEGTSVSVESSWSSKQNEDVKRHSIAVDESKYVYAKSQFPQLRRTSLAVAENGARHEDISNNDGLDDDTNNHLGKKQKKVEFCKTEVHFAAESGKVNIVETDEKPPPNNNFRNRRRRNSALANNHYVEDFNKNGLPLIHFGDTSYEKKLFGVSDHESNIVQPVEPIESFTTDTGSYSNGAESTVCNNTVTVSSVSITKDYEPEQKENHEVENPPRGILKNKMIKPKPYILGDDNNELISKDTNEDLPENSIWGVRLRPVHKQEEPQQIWKSTVTVQNTTFSKPTRETTISEQGNSENGQPEFQKMLHSLRPARKSEPSMGLSESVSESKVNTAMESRRSSWSVADLVRQVEDMRTTESKGYSTKVNFGSGEATVVENVDVTERHTTWPTSPEEALNKDFPSSKQMFQPSAQTRTVLSTENRSPQDKRSPTESKPGVVSVRCTIDRKSSDTSLTDSPQPERRQVNPTAAKKPFESLKVQYSNGSLSSPSLVGSSIQKSTKSYQTKKTESVILQAKHEDKEERTSAFSKINSNHVKDSPSLARRYVIRKNPPSYTSSQPVYAKRTEPVTKKSDSSTYYSQIHTRKPTKKLSERSRGQKPDLLQHYSDNRQYVNLSSVIKESSKSSVASKVNIEEGKNGSTKKKSTRPDSPSVERAESPIYENIDEVLNGLSNGIEKESSILQELTKAADQILQAVNGYTDDDSTKQSTDEEDDNRRHRIKNFKKTGEVLSTISETKSWKQVQSTKQKQVEVSRNMKNVRSRVRPTSSTSSIESVTRECQKPVVRPQKIANKTTEDKTKKKITSGNSELSKATRARRLQRASSREALLQSHGSSSEDISTSAEIIRKPRLVRRLKTQHSSTSEDMHSSSKKSVGSVTNVRRRECDIRRSSERSSVTGLQEIRHKTAVSTIKSTAEKAASREKAAKLKSEELRKRVSSRRDTSITKGGSALSSQTATAALGGGRAGVGVGAEGCMPVSAVRTSSGVSSRRVPGT